MAAALILTLVAVASWVFHLRSPYTRALAALERGDLLSSSGSSAVEIFDSLYREDPTSKSVQELGGKISEALRPEADAALLLFYSESTKDIDWPRVFRIYDFLAKASSDNREILARKVYCEAHIALTEGKYQLALDSYKAALEHQPNWPLALNGLAKIYARADSPFKDFTQARDFYLKAHHADPKFIFPLINLAQLSIIENQLGDAEHYLRRAIAINPKRSTVYRELGRVLWKQHRYGDAIEAYQQCLQYEPDPEVRIRVQRGIDELREKL